MRLLWHGEWIVAPAYARVAAGRLVRVEATVSLLALGAATGRVMRQPRRKVLRFLRTDGPAGTLRKVRSKLGEKRYTGDYRVVALVGFDADSGERVAGIACRVPSCAELLPVHPELVVPVAEGFDVSRLAGALSAQQALLGEHGRQSWLYSGMRPPEELRRAVADAVAAAGAPSAHAVLRPPAGEPDTATRIEIGPAPPAAVRHAAVLASGDYTRTEIVPALREAELGLAVLCDREPQVVAQAARELGFAAAASDAREAIESLPPGSLVVVSTAHDSHADLAAAGLDAGHWVFLEKPAVVTEDDLRRLVESARRSPERLELGYNRRYNPMVRKAREALAREQGPTTIACTVREVDLESDHWYLWPNQGTRVTGNLCHWIDLAIFLIGPGPLPREVSVSPPVAHGARADEERTIGVTFDDGSVAAITATNRGDGVRGVQEWIEARRGGLTARIDDLWKLSLVRGGTERASRTAFRDKSHQVMYREALGGLGSRGFGRHPLRDAIAGSLVQIAASEMVAGGAATRDLSGPVDEWLGWASVA